MRVESCEDGGNKVVVKPAPYECCTFKIIDQWDESEHPKTCDTMYVLRDGSGAYVWNYDQWVFLNGGSGGGISVPSDWLVDGSDPGAIANRPFKTIGSGLEVVNDELQGKKANWSVPTTNEAGILNRPFLFIGTGLYVDTADNLRIDPETIRQVAYSHRPFPKDTSDLNDRVDLYGWYRVTSELVIANVPPGYDQTEYLIECVRGESAIGNVQRVYSMKEIGLNPMFRTYTSDGWSEWKEI